MPRLVIYTASIGRQDEVQAPQLITDGATYICFTDIPEIVPPPWQARQAAWYTISPDPARAVRWYKILAHQHFPELGPDDVSIWQDSTHIGVRDYNEIIQDLGDHDLALLPHFSRDCLYDEADQVALNGLDDQNVILAHIESILLEGYPAHQGLHDGSFLVRRHTAAIAKFNDIWWLTIAMGSRRDQLSLDYALWKTKVRCLTLGVQQRLGGTSRTQNAIDTVVTNPLFAFQPRGRRVRPFMPWL
jgi:hypothetical protein